MATKRLLFSSSVTEVNELYTLCMIPNVNGPEMKICKTTLEGESGYGDHKLQIPSSVEFLDFNDELFYNAFKQAYDRTITEVVDPFIRWKYRGTRVYEILYGQKSGNNDKSISSDDLMRTIRNLIVCDVRTIMYLYHLAETESNELSKTVFLEFLRWPLNYKNTNRNARLKLGISKNKEKVLKDFPIAWILRYGNEVFDDDVDFLLDMLRAKRNDRNLLRYFLNAKQANPKLKYIDIARKAIITNLENKDAITFRRGMENINRLSEGYNILKKHGFKRQFRLVPTIAMLSLDTPNKAEEPNFTVPGGEVFPIIAVDELRYANAISNAMHGEYIEQARDRGCCFYLIHRHKKYYIAEVLDGEIINVFRNGQYVILDIERKETM